MVSSNSLRVHQTDDIGNLLRPPILARGSFPISFQQSATTASGAATWMLANTLGGTRTIVVTKVWYQYSFNGTGAASAMAYELGKMTGFSAFSDGAAVTAIEAVTGLGAPTNAECRVLDTGITVGAAVFVRALGMGEWPRLTLSATQAGNASSIFSIDFHGPGYDGIELAAAEALAIRNLGTAVVGDRVYGGCQYYEKA